MRRIKLFTHPLAVWLILGTGGFIAGVILAACQSTGIVCSAGLSRCGLGCADFKSDTQNCGACGVACQSLQICQNSACQCRPEATLCGSTCVVTSSDPQNCGGCNSDGGGVACGPAQVCNQGRCADRCTPDGGLTACAQGCVDLRSDPLNCGQCGSQCLTGQSCRDGGTCSSDVVAACFDTGQVVGLQAGPDVLSERHAIGANPQTLGAMQGILLAADGIDQRLRQMRLQDFNVLSNFNALGSSPNHVFVDDPYVYVVNSLGNTLQVLRRNGVATADGGLQFSIPAGGELSFGSSTSPQSIAKLGNNLYIPLWVTGQVAEVDVSNPESPVRRRTFSLSGLDLRSFDGGVTFPRPVGIAAYRGSIYVALSNLDGSALPLPAGPGMLAQLNVATDPVVPIPIYLPSTCLNTYWLVTAGDTLYVSCSGLGTRDTSYHLTAIDRSAVVAVVADGGITLWNGACDGGCFGASPGRFAVLGNRLYIGDQLGRMFVIDNLDGGFVERRGYNFATGGLPISACQSSPSGFANVIDVIPIP